MNKFGKKAGDIFSRPNNSIPQQEAANVPTVVVEEPNLHKLSLAGNRGRPQEHKEPWTKVTVLLMDRQINWLDQLAVDIRLKTKFAISRAEALRAIVDAIKESGIDLTDVQSETQLKETLLQKLSKC